MGWWRFYAGYLAWDDRHLDDGLSVEFEYTRAYKEWTGRGLARLQSGPRLLPGCAAVGVVLFRHDRRPGFWTDGRVPGRSVLQGYRQRRINERRSRKPFALLLPPDAGYGQPGWAHCHGRSGPSESRKRGSILLLNISVLNRGEMEDAIIHPELHQNLFVRVGGFSVRFVNLDPGTQADMLARALY